MQKKIKIIKSCFSLNEQKDKSYLIIFFDMHHITIHGCFWLFATIEANPTMTTSASSSNLFDLTSSVCCTAFAFVITTDSSYCRYLNLETFIIDVNLVFDNCERFNEDNSDIGRAGHAMRRFFQRRWTELLRQNSLKASLGT